MVVTRPRLIGLLAAHFASPDQGRLERLRRLLRSVQEQTYPVPLLLSWSVEDSLDVGAQTQDVLDEFAASGVLHAMPCLRGRRSQFQHYARLRNTLRRHVTPEDNPWVFFSDDDDLWHPRRAEEFLTAIEDRPKGEDVVYSRVHASPGLAPRLPFTATADDVTAMEAEGQLRVSIGPEKAEPGLFGTSSGEYFDAAAAFRVFDTFFEQHNDAVISNRFADIRFRTFMLKWLGGVYRFLPKGARNSAGGNDRGQMPWMYFYDRPTTAYTTPPGPEDMKYVSKELPDPERIAGLRQTLDCVLFQLAPTSGPLTISQREFAESLVGMLKEQNAATVAMALDRCQMHGVQVGD